MKLNDKVDTMSLKKLMNQVKFEVRRQALAMREFCVADIVSVTGFNPSSVRTELQRMKNLGFIFSKESEAKKGKSRVVVYQLSENAHLRVELAKSTQGFHARVNPPEHPYSRYYWSAKNKITSAYNNPEPKRSQLLSEAEKELKTAWSAEGGPVITEKVKAFLELEEGRIYYLREQFKEARERFQTLLPLFTDIYDESQRRLLQECIACLDFKEKYSKCSRKELIDRFQQTMKDITPESPLYYLLLEMQSLDSKKTTDPGTVVGYKKKNNLVPVEPENGTLQTQHFTPHETESLWKVFHFDTPSKSGIYDGANYAPSHQTIKK